MSAVETITAEKTYTVTLWKSQHGHDVIEGTYTGPVTSADVAAKYYHDWFGGRDAVAADGRFSAIRHTD